MYVGTELTVCEKKELMKTFGSRKIKVGEQGGNGGQLTTYFVI